jgi:hypothetical protein
MRVRSMTLNSLRGSCGCYGYDPFPRPFARSPHASQRSRAAQLAACMLHTQPWGISEDQARMAWCSSPQTPGRHCAPNHRFPSTQIRQVSFRQQGPLCRGLRLRVMARAAGFGKPTSTVPKDLQTPRGIPTGRARASERCCRPGREAVGCKTS